MAGSTSGAARPSGLRPLAILVAGALLSTCGATVEEVQLRIDDAERGVVIAALSVPVPEGQQDNVVNSIAYKSAEHQRQRFPACGISSALYDRGEVLRLDIRAEFTDAAQANSKSNCLAPHSQTPSIAFMREPGMLWDTYVTTFAVRHATEPCDTCAHPPRLFPRSMALTVPGTVSRIEDLSDILGARVAARRVDADTVRADVQETGNYAQLNRDYFARLPGRDRKIDVLSLRITSTEAHYDLGTFLSGFGLLFGSGLALELGRRAFRRRGTGNPDGGG